MDRSGEQRKPWTFSAPPSKPLVGILGDVDGRIVPVAPPPVFEFDPDIASYAVYRLIELLLPPAQNEGRGTSSTNVSRWPVPSPRCHPVITATLSCSVPFIDLPPR